MEEITEENKNDIPKPYLLPYSETKTKTKMLSTPRERIELG